MNLGIKGKTAIVCGASQGLGRACAEQLALEGANLVLCSREFDRVFATARSIAETYGVTTIPVAGDLALPETPQKLATEAEKRFGAVHILVNNAGGPPSGVFDSVDDAAWERAFQLTLMSAVRMIRAVLPIMERQGWGRIINLASISIKQPIPGLILSNALRAAVAGMAKTVSAEIAKNGILVNTIATGSFDTERIRTIAGDRARVRGVTQEEVRSDMEAAIPLGRLGRPEELAAFVAFLASERSSFITGATFSIDGGQCLSLL